jgi:hypothetical protein
MNQSETDMCPRPITPCDAFGFRALSIEVPSVAILRHVSSDGVGRLRPSCSAQAPLPCETHEYKLKWIG